MASQMLSLFGELGEIMETQQLTLCSRTEYVLSGRQLHHSELLGSACQRKYSTPQCKYDDSVHFHRCAVFQGLGSTRADSQLGVLAAAWRVLFRASPPPLHRHQLPASSLCTQGIHHLLGTGKMSDRNSHLNVRTLFFFNRKALLYMMVRVFSKIIIGTWGSLAISGNLNHYV